MEEMKVFISWSGEPTKKVALALGEWLPKLIPGVKVWVSDEHLRKGLRWSVELAAELDSTTYGLILVTRANQAEPYLNFEAGALSKKVRETAHVVPILLDLDFSDVTTPLKEFQGTRFETDKMFETFAELNELADSKLPKESLRTLFDANWSKLKEIADEALASGDSPVVTDERTEKQMLIELIDLVRSQAVSTRVDVNTYGPVATFQSRPSEFNTSHRQAFDAEVPDILERFDILHYQIWWDPAHEDRPIIATPKRLPPEANVQIRRLGAELHVHPVFRTTAMASAEPPRTYSLTSGGSGPG